MIKNFSFFAVFAFLVGCSSEPTVKDIDGIKTGAAKYDVLEKLGEPKSIRRVRAEDHWAYEINDKKGRTVVREIHFDAGKVIYVGPPKKENEKSETGQSNATASTGAVPSAKQKPNHKNLYEELERDMKGQKKKKLEYEDL